MTFTFTATRGYNPQNIQSSSAKKDNNLKILHHRHPPPWLVITPELASGVLRTTSVQANREHYASVLALWSFILYPARALMAGPLAFC